MAKQYDHVKVEKKWQQRWEKENWQLGGDAPAKKFYVLDMFPYPSAQGLHVGHPEGYTASDIVSRYRRMKGDDVLHPMGFDSFGLPAENFAIKTGTHPAVTTAENIKNMRRQIQSLGFSYDWTREVITSDPKYYKWTQWIFVQLFKHGLAYEAEAPINWCPKDKTGLANEEVVAGKCERCGTPVVKKKIKQWLVKITDERYIERLLNDLDNVDWPENIKLLQRNWIGRSEGALVKFQISSTKFQTNSKSQVPNSKQFIEVFTTRPDTLFGATYLVVAPEHPLIESSREIISNWKEVDSYIKKAVNKSDLERTDLAKGKTGVELKGLVAINPVNNKGIPVWVADYVLSTYGTGAIMAVPAHDERDFEFAKKFKLPIIKVIEPPRVMQRSPFEAQNISAGGYGHLDADLTSACWTGDGTMVNSGQYDGLDTMEFKKVIVIQLAKEGKARSSVQYKLRDWLFSRQRYWGEPIPIVHCERCKKLTVLIIHGTGSNSKSNWYDWLATELRKHGHEVIVPDMPDSAQPDRVKWLTALDELKDKLDENTILIGHSLGGMAAMYFLSSQKKKIKKLILVAPTSKAMDWVEFKKQHPNDPVEWQKKFHDADLQLKKVQKNAEEISYYYSDNDVYIPVAIPEQYKKELHGNYHFLPGRNHFSFKNGKADTFPELLQEIVGDTAEVVPVPEDQLPVLLPDIKKYEPTGTGDSPLANVKEWVNTKCPKCGGPAKRETNTMPQWAGSNWYFLRYCDPHNDTMLADPKKLKAWLPVDLYIGGAEHAVLHLLYARFIYKFLYDIGVVPMECGDEPFKKLKNQGLILGEDGQKMSKSRGNVINPDEVIKKFGADTMRMYEMFMGPFEDAKPWNTQGLIGVKRFLDKVWEMGITLSKQHIPNDPEAHRKINQTIKKVTDDIEAFKFNTIVSTLMQYINYLRNRKEIVTRGEFSIFLQLLSPLAPHIAEELWEILGNKESILKHPWPQPVQRYLANLSFSAVIQVNGKVRDQIEMHINVSEEEIKAIALARPKIQKWLAGKEPKKVIYVKGKLVSIVA